MDRLELEDLESSTGPAICDETGMVLERNLINDELHAALSIVQVTVENEELAGNSGPGDNGVINNQSLFERNNKTNRHVSYACAVRSGTVTEKQ